MKAQLPVPYLNEKLATGSLLPRADDAHPDAERRRLGGESARRIDDIVAHAGAVGSGLHKGSVGKGEAMGRITIRGLISVGLLLLFAGAALLFE